MTRLPIALLFAVFLLAGMGCKTQQSLNVKHIRSLETGHSQQGFYYALPRTVVSMDVTVIKTEEIPGPFARFAGNYLGLEQVIMQPSTTYHIQNVSINTFAEPDPSEFYFVEYDPKKMQDTPFSLYLNEAGLIAAVNTSFDNDYYMKNMPEGNGRGFFGSQASFQQFIEMNLEERVDTIIEQVQVDTMTVERKTLRRTWVEKSSESRAREVAEHILKIRNKKFDLISGFAEITYSKEAIEYMYKEMDKLENDYLELFTGMRVQSRIKYRYNYTPDKNRVDTPATLFYFSPAEGVVQQGRRGSEPFTIEVNRNQTTQQLGVFGLTPSRDKSEKRGIYYRVPEHGNISVKLGNASLANARVLINQLGVITSLPPGHLQIEFFPNTGSVKSIQRVIEE